ncbi:MAG: beta-galactosidase trimerization domain-containing protein [Sedimentisphaerales bacterium]
MRIKLNDCYARFLVDNHITEHDPSFMSKFDPENYVAMIKKSGFQASMVYACCHNGNCYYPTKVGHMHKNLNGRDVFGQTVSLLRKENIVPLAYYTVVYQRDIARSHPEWRLTYIDGTQHYRRSWYNCPNHHEYVDFVKKQLQEIAVYDIDGIFIDMTFWPGVCVCQTCRQKYQDEYKKELPEIIDWKNPEWMQFQRARERWLGDFAQTLTNAIKQIKPAMLVTHQFSPVLLGWYYAQRHIAKACDYTSGDFYGGILQQRLGTKVMAAFSKKMPYEFMTSRCITLYDHTSTKSEIELLGNGATTLANGGAYFFIDAINPDGTLNPKNYDLLSRVNALLKPFTHKLTEHKPILMAETALYYSMASHINQAHNGINLLQLINPANNMNPSSDIPSVKELLGAAAVLNKAHIAYKIITDETQNLSGIKTIIMNDIQCLSDAELKRIRKFVNDGGTLIATGMSSFCDLNGISTGNFALKDVFGVSYSGKQSSRAHYLVLKNGEQISCNCPAPLVCADTAEAMGNVAEPIFDPDDFEHFAAYHSNPPGHVSQYAGITINSYGKGKCIYLYSSIFAVQQESQQTFAKAILKEYATSDLFIDSNAPPCVEITMLKSTTANTMLLCFVNFQNESPNVPIHNIKITFQLPKEFELHSFTQIGTSQKMHYAKQNNVYTLELPKLETIEMIEIY